MKATLHIPYSNGDPTEGFRYDKPEISKEQYSRMLIDTFNKYKDGVWETYTQRFGRNMSVNNYQKEYVQVKQQDYYYANTPVRIMSIDGSDCTIDELIHYYQTGEPFIIQINMPYLGKEENADLESDMMQWARECRRITESGKFSREEQIKYLSKKSLKVQFDEAKSMAILKNCKMAKYINNRTFAFLVEEIIFITEA